MVHPVRNEKNPATTITPKRDLPLKTLFVNFNFGRFHDAHGFKIIFVRPLRAGSIPHVCAFPYPVRTVVQRSAGVYSGCVQRKRKLVFAFCNVFDIQIKGSESYFSHVLAVKLNSYHRAAVIILSNADISAVALKRKFISNFRAVERQSLIGNRTERYFIGHGGNHGFSARDAHAEITEKEHIFKAYAFTDGRAHDKLVDAFFNGRQFYGAYVLIHKPAVGINGNGFTVKGNFRRLFERKTAFRFRLAFESKP